MTLIDLTWANFKTLVTDKSRMRYIEKETYYNVYYTDEGGEFVASIQKDAGADQTEFEASYKSLANKPKLIPLDSDGSPLQRAKITTTGWHYQLHGLEFTTSKLDSIHSKKTDGTDYGFTTIKCYGTDGVEITDPATALTSAVKSVIDWEPTHDIEIVGGMVKQIALPTTDIRLWVVGVPDVPLAYGGSKPFATNINMKFMGLEEGVRVDGRAPKYLPYSAVNHTTKLRLILIHPAGTQHILMMVFEIFKP